MIKSITRIWFYVYIIISYFFGIYLLSNRINKPDSSIIFSLLGYTFIILLFFGFPIFLSSKAKTIIIDNNGIEIRFPFLLKSSFFFFSEIDYYSTNDFYHSFIRFKEMKIRFKNNKSMIVTSAANTLFQQIDLLLQQKIEKIDSTSSPNK